MYKKPSLAVSVLGIVAVTVIAAPPLLAADRDNDDEVVAPGPPALTRGAVRQIGAFLEFALDSRLTNEERALFERAEIESWRVSTAKQREDSLQIARMQPTIANLGASEREEIKRKVQPQMLETLRKAPTEPVSKLLLAVYQRSQPSRAPVVAVASSRSGVPAELAGDWSAVHSTASVNYVNQTTGSWAPPSGDGSSYRIFADGRFEYTGLIQSSMYNCTMTVTPFESGTLRFDGGLIYFDSVGGTLDSKDNCNSRFNYRKPLPANSKAYSWKVERDQGGTRFCIWSANVKESCVYKK